MATRQPPHHRVQTLTLVDGNRVIIHTLDGFDLIKEGLRHRGFLVDAIAGVFDVMPGEREELRRYYLFGWQPDMGDVALDLNANFTRFKCLLAETLANWHGLGLEQIARVLDGREWDVEDLNTIAELLREHGREIREPVNFEFARFELDSLAAANQQFRNLTLFVNMRQRKLCYAELDQGTAHCRALSGAELNAAMDKVDGNIELFDFWEAELQKPQNAWRGLDEQPTYVGIPQLVDVHDNLVVIGEYRVKAWTPLECREKAHFQLRSDVSMSHLQAFMLKAGLRIGFEAKLAE